MENLQKVDHRYKREREQQLCRGLICPIAEAEILLQLHCKS